MRPIKLALEGFTVYRKRQEIDFSGLNFFIIQGRTGSGKTSIIDAICYALYGKVPRHGKQEVESKLLSKGSSRMYVRFDFSVRGKMYAVERFYDDINNRSEARLYEDGRRLNIKKSEIPKKITDILNVDYDTFTKVVVLPQGQFDKFLKPSSPKERREILNKLLGYDELFKRASEYLKDRVSRLQLEKGKLEEGLRIFGQYGERELEEARERERELQSQVEELSRVADELTSRVSELDKLATEYMELQEKLENYRSLKSKEQDYAKKKELVEKIKEISQYRHIIEEYEKNRRDVREKEEESDKLKLKIERIKQELLDLGEKYAKAEQEYRTLHEKEERVKLLSALHTSLEDLLRDEMRVKGLEEEVRDIALRVEDLRRTFQELEGRVANGDKAVSEKEREVEELQEKERKLIGFYQLKDSAQELKRIEDEERHLTSEMSELQAKVENISREKEKKRQELLDAYVGELAKNLKEGDRCPVCGSTIERLNISHVRTDFERIKRELERKEKEERDAVAQLEQLRGRFNSLRERMERIKQKLGEHTAEEVLEKCKEYEETYRNLEEARQKLRKYTEALQKLREQMEDTTTRLTQEETKLSEKQKQIEELRQKIRSKKEHMERDLGREIDSLEEELSNVRREKKILEEDIRRIRQDYERLRKDVEDKERELARLEGQKSQIDEGIEELTKRNQSIAPQYYEILKKYESIETIRSYLNQVDKLKELEEELGRYDRELHALEERIRELKEKTSSYDPEEHRRLKDKHKEVKERLEEKKGELWNAKRLTEEINKAIERAKELQREREEIERKISIYERLKTDFESNRFPDYVSSIMLDMIVEKASRYLFELSGGRYEFEASDGNLLINESGVGERDVSTLSGGETFLASLALAFGVADVVSHGAVIESIFIDEGFGSLDRETRESLGEFFELIRNNAGRMVGIISHLDDLKERFDQRIEVRKRGIYSEVEVIC